MTRLSIGIATLNRPESLETCLRSMSVLAALEPDIIVHDDGSDPPVRDGLMAGPLPVRVLRGRVGLTGGRNRMAAAAVGEFVLFLDDDTVMLSSESIESAIAVMDADPSVGAVAFAQAESGGQPWPAHMQPSPADRPVVVPAFIGFGHLVRRSMLLKLSGFRERFDCYGEEKEFCLRLLNAGYKTVYLPQALIAHVPDPRSRDMRRYLRLVARNDCLNTLYNDPLARVMWMLPARVALYFRMRRAWKVSDRGGGVWLIRELLRLLPEVWRDRRPVSRTTLARFRALRRSPEPYATPVAPMGVSRVG